MKAHPKLVRGGAASCRPVCCGISPVPPLQWRGHVQQLMTARAAPTPDPPPAGSPTPATAATSLQRPAGRQLSRRQQEAELWSVEGNVGGGPAPPPLPLPPPQQQQHHPQRQGACGGVTQHGPKPDSGPGGEAAPGRLASDELRAQMDAGLLLAGGRHRTRQPVPAAAPAATARAAGAEAESEVDPHAEAAAEAGGGRGMSVLDGSAGVHGRNGGGGAGGPLLQGQLPSTSPRAVVGWAPGSEVAPEVGAAVADQVGTTEGLNGNAHGIGKGEEEAAGRLVSGDGGEDRGADVGCAGDGGGGGGGGGVADDKRAVGGRSVLRLRRPGQEAATARRRMRVQLSQRPQPWLVKALLQAQREEGAGRAEEHEGEEGPGRLEGVEAAARGLGLDDGAFPPLPKPEEEEEEEEGLDNGVEQQQQLERGKQLSQRQHGQEQQQGLGQQQQQQQGQGQGQGRPEQTRLQRRQAREQRQKQGQEAGAVPAVPRAQAPAPQAAAAATPPPPRERPRPRVASVACHADGTLWSPRQCDLGQLANSVLQRLQPQLLQPQLEPLLQSQGQQQQGQLVPERESGGSAGVGRMCHVLVSGVNQNYNLLRALSYNQELLRVASYNGLTAGRGGSGSGVGGGDGGGGEGPPALGFAARGVPPAALRRYWEETLKSGTGQSPQVGAGPLRWAPDAQKERHQVGQQQGGQQRQRQQQGQQQGQASGGVPAQQPTQRQKEQPSATRMEEEAEAAAAVPSGWPSDVKELRPSALMSVFLLPHVLVPPPRPHSLRGSGGGGGGDIRGGGSSSMKVGGTGSSSGGRRASGSSGGGGTSSSSSGSGAGVGSSSGSGGGGNLPPLAVGAHTDLRPLVALAGDRLRRHGFCRILALGREAASNAVQVLYRTSMYLTMEGLGVVALPSMTAIAPQPTGRTSTATVTSRAAAAAARRPYGQVAAVAAAVAPVLLDKAPQLVLDLVACGWDEGGRPVLPGWALGETAAAAEASEEEPQDLEGVQGQEERQGLEGAQGQEEKQGLEGLEEEAGAAALWNDSGVPVEAPAPPPLQPAALASQDQPPSLPVTLRLPSGVPDAQASAGGRGGSRTHGGVGGDDSSGEGGDYSSGEGGADGSGGGGITSIKLGLSSPSTKAAAAAVVGGLVARQRVRLVAKDVDGSLRMSAVLHAAQSQLKGPDAPVRGALLFTVRGPALESAAAAEEEQKKNAHDVEVTAASSMTGAAASTSGQLIAKVLLAPFLALQQHLDALPQPHPGDLVLLDRERPAEWMAEEAEVAEAADAAKADGPRLGFVGSTVVTTGGVGEDDGKSDDDRRDDGSRVPCGDGHRAGASVHNINGGDDGSGGSDGGGGGPEIGAVAAALTEQLARYGAAAVVASGLACRRVALLAVAAVSESLLAGEGLTVLVRAEQMGRQGRMGPAGKAGGGRIPPGTRYQLLLAQVDAAAGAATLLRPKDIAAAAAAATAAGAAAAAAETTSINARPARGGSGKKRRRRVEAQGG